MEKTLKTLLFGILVLVAPRVYADDLLSDASENSNRQACKDSGGKYLYPHAAPRCKCPEGKVNNWTRGDVNKAADMCVDDPKAKKAGTASKSKKQRAPKVVQVAPPPPAPAPVVKTLCELSGGQDQPDGHCKCLKAGTVEGVRDGINVCVERQKTACEVSGGEIQPDGRCKCAAGFDAAVVDGNFVCRLHVKTTCELSGGQDLPGGRCKCVAPNTVEGKNAAGNFFCALRPKNACELSGGQDLPDGHCKCTIPNTMEGKDKDGKFVCVAKPMASSRTFIKESYYTSNRWAMMSHLMLESKLSMVDHPKYAGGFLAAGLVLDVSKLVSLYVELGLGMPGAIKVDGDGNPILNDNGAKQRWTLSGIVEGGLMMYFDDHFGLRLGAVWEPIGMTTKAKFTYAEAGGVIGPMFAVAPARWLTLVLSPTLYVGVELSNGKGSAPTAVGGMINLAAIFTIGKGEDSSQSSSSEEKTGEPEAKPAKVQPAPTPASAPSPPRVDGSPTNIGDI